MQIQRKYALNALNTYYFPCTYIIQRQIHIFNCYTNILYCKSGNFSLYFLYKMLPGLKS